MLVQFEIDIDDRFLGSGCRVNTTNRTNMICDKAICYLLISITINTAKVKQQNHFS